MSKEENKALHRAHERSLSYGIKPDELSPRIILDEKSLEKYRTKNKIFLDISRPFINELIELLGGSNGYIATLTDSAGVILEVFGDDEDILQAKKLNLKKGANMNEKSIGTNAMGTAIREGRAVQISGKEHFAKAFQRYACFAAPVHDSNNIIIGTLNLTADIKNVYPFTLAIINSIARAIENRIHNSVIQRQLYDAQQFSFSIINHLSFGIIAIDLKNTIHWVNDTACRSLNIRRTHLINKDISFLYAHWEDLKRRIKRGEDILDKEAELYSKSGNKRYLLNGYPITNPTGDSLGYVISFRPFSRMLNLINKYSSLQLKYTFEQIIFKSKKMKRLVDYAENVAKTPSTVLITGESGTGKEVFAQAIHNASNRRENVFIAVNCGAISESLIESELFGYEEGAFTGALKGGKPGKFELADKGTLFLDEIGEMSLEMQVRLLRVLQDKTVTRIGGSKATKLDVRLIAATNKDLTKEVADNKFRQDLFYRLSVIPLHIPPLRERKMDIPVLFQHFIARKADLLDRPIPEVENRLMKKLVAYSWPGNIRELENFAEKTVILSGNIEQLFPEYKPEENSNISGDFYIDKENLPSLKKVEKKLIEYYLIHFEGNISKTAKTLGIGRNTLYQKMQKFNIKN